MQVRLSALQGDFNTREPDGSFLRRIVGGASAKPYDPLHGIPTTPRSDWLIASQTARTHPHAHGHARTTSRGGDDHSGSRSARSSVTRATTSERAKRHERTHSTRSNPSSATTTTPPASSEEAASYLPGPTNNLAVTPVASSNAPTNVDSVVSTSVVSPPSGREFEPIPPVPSYSPRRSHPSHVGARDKHLLASVRDHSEHEGGEDEDEDEKDDDPPIEIDYGKRDRQRSRSRSTSRTTEVVTRDDAKSSGARDDSQVVSDSVDANTTDPCTSAPIRPPSSTTTHYRSALKSSSSDRSSSASHHHRRRSSVSWATTTCPNESTNDDMKQSLEEDNTTVVATDSSPRSHTQSSDAQPPVNSSSPLHPRRPQTADRAMPSTTKDSATVTVTATATTAAKSKSSKPSAPSRPKTGGPTRTRRKSTSSYIIPNGLTTFGYTDRQLNISSLGTDLDHFTSGSSAQPLDIIARPRATRNDSGGSSGLAHRGCNVKYRSTPSDYRDPLTAKLRDALVGGEHTILDLKAFRRDIELLTNTAQVSNATIKRILNERSTVERVALMRRQAEKKRKDQLANGSGVAGGDGDGNGGERALSAELTGIQNTGLTHRLYQPVQSAKSTIPARYPKLAGTNVTPIPHAPDFGAALDSNPFRVGVPCGPASAAATTTTMMTRGTNSTRPLTFDASVYVGPGTYHPSDALTHPSVQQSVAYGPPHSNFLHELDEFKKRTTDGPGSYDVRYTLQDKRPLGHVSFHRTRGRGAFEFMGVHTSLANPSPDAYAPEKHQRLWSDALAHRHTEHAFGHERRFEMTQFKSPSSSSSCESGVHMTKPERMLLLAGPKDGPGTLHRVIPSRTGERSRYDPNVETYLTSCGIPKLDSSLAQRYLTQDEFDGRRVASDSEDEKGEKSTTTTTTTIHHHVNPNHITHTRATDLRMREVDHLLSSALLTTPSTHAQVKRRPDLQLDDGSYLTSLPLPIHHTPSSTLQPKVFDPSTLPVIEPPSVRELKLRRACFQRSRSSSPSPSPTSNDRTRHVHQRSTSLSPSPSPSSSSPTRTTPATVTVMNCKSTDVVHRNRVAVSDASPRTRAQSHASKCVDAKLHRRAVLEKAARLHENRLQRLREKMVAGETLANRMRDGTLITRWLVSVSVAARAHWWLRVLTFTRRMTSDHQLRHRAATLIARYWRRHHQRRLAARRHQAITTLNRVFGTFRVRLRIRRKQKAANLLRTFFRTVLSPSYQPPLAVNTRTLAAAPRVTLVTEDGTNSSIDGEPQVDPHIAAIAAAKRRRAMLAKVRQKTGNDRTLVGLIKHFKNQVVIIQRAWRAYCLMREYQVDMHVLYFDEIVQEHWHDLYASKSGSSTPNGITGGGGGGDKSVRTHLERRRSLRFGRDRAEYDRLVEGNVNVTWCGDEDRSSAPVSRPLSRPASSTGSTPMVPSSPISTPSQSILPSPLGSPSHSPAHSPSSTSTSPAHTSRRIVKSKPITLKMDGRFTHGEKRQILLEALRQRKLRFIRVKRQYMRQQAQYVQDQSVSSPNNNNNNNNK